MKEVSAVHALCGTMVGNILFVMVIGEDDDFPEKSVDKNFFTSHIINRDDGHRQNMYGGS